MKKKFINGFLMAAMLFAATSSFVSCKDNIDDDLTDVYAQLGKKSGDLQNKIDDLQRQINEKEYVINNYITNIDTTINNYFITVDSSITILDTRVDSVIDVLNVLNQEITNMTLDIDSINNALTNIDVRINSMGDSLSTIWSRVDSIVNLLDALVDGNLITSVEINATRNDVLGIINTPFLVTNSLLAYYGTNEAGIEQFPYAGYDYNVGGNRFAEYLEEYELPDDGFVTFDESDYITDTYANAGQVYFTVNSTNYEDFDISKLAKITIENTAGEIAPIDLKVRKSTARVNYSLGRAFLEETGKDAKNGLYVADATIKEENLDPNQFQINKFINFEKLKTEIRARIDDIQDRDGETTDKAYTAFFKNFVREICGLVFGLFKNDLTSYDYANNMSYSPQRLVFYAEKGGQLKRVAQSETNMWVSAITPLSYGTFWLYENNKKDNWVLENALERVVSKVAKEIKERWGDKGITAKIVKLDEVNESVIIQLNGTKETIKVSNDKYMSDFKKAIKVNGGLDACNDKLAKLLKTYTLGTAVGKVEERINTYIDKCSDYLTNLIHKHLFTRAVAPIIIFETGTGMERLCEGMFVNRGIMHAYLTSGTMELLVPAYKKYVAVEKNGMLLQSAVLPGNTLTYDFDLNELGDYKVIISCVDYFGYVVTKKYDVYVVK